MYAIIVTGGKQYRVEQGDIVYIEKLDVEADSEVKFDQVLAIGEEGSVSKFPICSEKQEPHIISRSVC